MAEFIRSLFSSLRGGTTPEVPPPPDPCWNNLSGSAIELKELLQREYPNVVVDEGPENIEKIKYIADEILDMQRTPARRHSECHNKAQAFLNAYNACANNLSPGVAGPPPPLQAAMRKELLAQKNRRKGGVVGAYFALKYREAQIQATQFLCDTTRSNALHEERQRLSVEFTRLIENRDPNDLPPEEDSALIAPILEQYVSYLSRKIAATNEVLSLEKKIGKEEKRYEDLARRIRAVDPTRLQESPSIFTRIYLAIRWFFHVIGLYQHSDRNLIEDLCTEYEQKRRTLIELSLKKGTPLSTSTYPFSTISISQPPPMTKEEQLITHLKERIDSAQNRRVQNIVLHYLEQVKDKYHLVIDGDNITIYLDNPITTDPLPLDTPLPNIPMCPRPLRLNNTNLETISTAYSDTASDVTTNPDDMLDALSTTSEGGESFVVLNLPPTPPTEIPNDTTLISIDEFSSTPLNALTNGYRSISKRWLDYLKGAKFSLPKTVKMCVKDNTIEFVENKPIITIKLYSFPFSVTLSSISLEKIEHPEYAIRELAEITVRGECAGIQQEVTCTLTDANILLSRLFSIEAIGIAG